MLFSNGVHSDSPVWCETYRWWKKGEVDLQNIYFYGGVDTHLSHVTVFNIDLQTYKTIVLELIGTIQIIGKKVKC